MSGCYPDGCTPRDFDLAMMALGEPGVEETEWSEPPEAEPGDPGPEFREDYMRVSLIFDTEEVFTGAVRPIIEAYLRGEHNARQACRLLGWSPEQWAVTMGGLFDVAHGSTYPQISPGGSLRRKTGAADQTTLRVHPPLPPEVAGELAARISRICGFVDAELQDLSDSELTTVRDFVVKHYEWLGL